MPKGFLRRKINKIFETEIYNERNKIETIMFLIKNTGIVIRSKKRNNKIKELAWNILSYNIERLTKFLQKLWIINNLLGQSLKINRFINDSNFLENNYLLNFE